MNYNSSLQICQGKQLLFCFFKKQQRKRYYYLNWSMTLLPQVLLVSTYIPFAVHKTRRNFMQSEWNFLGIWRFITQVFLNIISCKGGKTKNRLFLRWNHLAASAVFYFLLLNIYVSMLFAANTHKMCMHVNIIFLFRRIS